MKPDNFTSEARAKITWGEPASSVRSFLISNGVSEIEADARIRELQEERNMEIRKVGIRKALIGAALVIGAGLFFYFSFRHADWDKMNYRAARGYLAIAIVIAFGGFFGLSKLIDGIVYVARPRSVDKSISEM